MRRSLCFVLYCIFVCNGVYTTAFVVSQLSLNKASPGGICSHLHGVVHGPVQPVSVPEVHLDLCNRPCCPSLVTPQSPVGAGAKQLHSGCCTHLSV